MGTRVVKVLGFSGRESQFSLRTEKESFVVNDSKELVRAKNTENEEFILAQLAGSIHAVGNLLGGTLKLDLKSIQIEVSGVLQNVNKEGEEVVEKFKRIDVVVKPTTGASIVVLKEWMDAIKLACPIFKNLKDKTPTIVTLVKDYEDVKVA